MRRFIGVLYTGWMKFGLLSMIAAVPLLGASLPLRLLLLIPCWAATAGLWIKWFGSAGGSGQHTSPDKIKIPFGDHDKNLRQMIDQLKKVIQQTEQASLTINERFMNIAGRARRQLQTTREIVGTQERDGKTTAGANAGVTTLLDAVTVETSMLAGDINNIIESLQFQDITRQHIEQVIAQIRELLHEVERVRQRSGANKMQRATDEGRSNGEDLSDR